MDILVINCGSSSLKYKLFDSKTEEVKATGLVERIGINGSRLVQEVNNKEFTIEEDMKNHTEAIKHVFDALLNEKYGALKNLEEIEAIGHRVLMGGEKITKSCIIDEGVKDIIRDCIKLGPLHNPANLMGIEACEKLLPGKPNVAVFDTSFHQTMPAANYMYGIPYEYYEKHQIRKFGFHGTSHRYVSLRVSQLLNKKLEDLNLITVHLGNGSSISAIKNGKCYDTSMGLTPLEGLLMGTRSGDLDPTVVTFLMDEENLTSKEVNEILNKKSGFLGISGISSDYRDLENAAKEGNKRAQLALDMFINRCKKYIGAYMAELGRVDAICFAGGIGENGINARKLILEGFENFGVEIDEEKNNVRKEAIISTDESKIKAFVVPTNEELIISRDTYELVK